MNVIEPGELQGLTLGENIILYDTDGLMAGVVVWDFIQRGSTPGTLGHVLVDYIDATVCKLASLIRNVRVSRLNFCSILLANICQRDDLGRISQLGYTSARNEQIGKKRNVAKESLHNVNTALTIASGKSSAAPMGKADPAYLVSSKDRKITSHRIARKRSKATTTPPATSHDTIAAPTEPTNPTPPILPKPNHSTT